MSRLIIFIIYLSQIIGKPTWQIVEVEDDESLLEENSNEEITNSEMADVVQNFDNKDYGLNTSIFG